MLGLQVTFVCFFSIDSFWLAVCSPLSSVESLGCSQVCVWMHYQCTSGDLRFSYTCHICQGLRLVIGPLRETHLRGWGVCGWKHHLPMEWSGQWESWGNNSDIGSLPTERQTQDRLSMALLYAGVTNLTVAVKTRERNANTKYENHVKFLLERNIETRELGRQMSHLPMLLRTFKRSLLGIPVLPCVLDGL